MDPIGTVRGAGLVASYASPAANTIRLIDSVKDNRNNLSNVPMSLLQGAGKDFMDPDVQQAIEIAGIIPTGKAVSVPLKLAGKGVSAASKGLLKGVEKAATRTSADALSAASGGLLRGSPVRAARTAPEPDEFDAIINAAKAEDPTLGNVVPAGVEPPVFRSELDWDENMSVNYQVAVNKITDDLMRLQKGSLGEDPTLIKPLIDDSIAALDSEIGNLMGRNYNHNDLEDFLGKIADPDDYTVADATLAKRADDFISEVDTESVLWGADPESWLLDTQFGMDAAKSAAKGVSKPASEAENILKGVPNVSENKTSIQTLLDKGFADDPATWSTETAAKAKSFANRIWRERLKGDKRKLNLGTNEDLYRAGLGQPAGKNVKLGKPGEEGAQTVLAANPVNLVSDFVRSNAKYIELNPDDGLALGHDVARSLGGETSKYNIYMIPAKTNDAMKQLTFKEFIEKQMNETGLSMATVKDLWGLSHVYI